MKSNKYRILRYVIIKKHIVMKTLEQIIDIIEDKGISIDQYSEDGKLCGYELNTYTKGGVNEIIFLDFRDSTLNPTNVIDFLNVINRTVENIDIDEEIEKYREDEYYRLTFSLRSSLEDFEDWLNWLKKLIKEIN